MMRAFCVGALASSTALCGVISPAAASPKDTDDGASPAEATDLQRAAWGAAPPELGNFTLQGSVGAVMILPHLTAAARAGLGAGFGVSFNF